MTSSARIYRDWLRQLPHITGQSYAAIARRVGIATSTLTRVLRPNDPGTSMPNQRTIDRIVATFGVAPPVFARTPALSEPVPVPALPPALLLEPPGARDVALLDKLRIMLTSHYDDLTTQVMSSRALELIGYVPGDILVVHRGMRAEPGQVVVAEVKNWQDRSTETVVRQYHHAPPVELLLTRSEDPAEQQPLVIDGLRVRVTAVVLFRLKNNPSLRIAQSYESYE